MTKFLEIYGPGSVTYWTEAEESGESYLLKLESCPDGPRKKAVRLNLTTTETALCFIGDEIRFSFPSVDWENSPATEATVGVILDIYEDDGLTMVSVELAGGVWVKIARPSLRLMEIIRKRKDRMTTTKGMVI